MGMGARIIAGNNPTMAEEMAGYPRGIVLGDDGAAADGVFFALQAIVDCPVFDDAPINAEKTWMDCERVVLSIVCEGE